MVVSSTDALAATIGGIEDDTVIPANTPTQIQVSREVIWPKTSLLTTAGG